MNKVIGMNRDVTPLRMQEGEWRDAENIVITKNRQAVSNEESIARYGDVENAFLIIGVINLPNGYFQFSTKVTSDPNYDCRIDYIDEDGVSTCVIRDPALNFDVIRPIQGVYSINFKGEIEIAFWEDLTNASNPPRMLNRSCLPFAVNVDCSLVDPLDIDLLRQFPKVNCINIELDKVDYNGGTLKSGVYYVSVAYGFPDGSKSNYFANSNQISIIDDSPKSTFSNFDGCEPDTKTGCAINIRIIDLDTRFYSVSLAITSKIGGVLVTKEVEDIKINDTTLNYIFTGSEGITITTEEVIIPKASFERVFAGTIYNDKLYYGNVKTLAKPDIQSYINNAKVNWIATKEIDLHTIDGSYKNPNNIFSFRTYRSNAVYAFYIIARMVDGTRWAFPMIGRAAENLTIDGYTFSENALISDLVANGVVSINTATPLEVSTDARYYQFFDTTDNTGKMGYWENQDETYPDVDCMDIKNGVGTVIGTLRNNEKVRWMKMPSLTALNTHLGTDSYSAPVATTNLIIELTPTGFDSYGAGGKVISTFTTNNITTEGAFTNPPNYTEFLFAEDVQFTVDVNIDLSDIDGGVEFRILLLKSTGEAIDYVNENVNSGFGNPIDNWIITENIQVSCETGDTLTVLLRITDNGGIVGDEPNINAPSYIKFYKDNIANVPLTKKILGVKITDFAIPSELSENIVCYELGYAERTGKDLNVLDQDMTIVDGTNKFRTHPFDSLVTKQTPNVDFIEKHYRFNNINLTNYNAQYPMNDRTANNLLAHVSESFYVIDDVTVPINNEYREEILFLKLTGTYGNYGLIDLMSFKENLYLGIFDNKIVSTGLNWLPTVATSPDIYGGDTFISLYGVLVTQITNANEDVFKFVAHTKQNKYIYPVESFSNINLRHSEDNHHYFPRDNNFDNELIDDTDLPDVVNQMTNGLKYNTDYSSVNNLFPIIIAKCDEECTNSQDINSMPFRIVRSIVNNRGQYGTNWRTFLLNDYYSMPTNKGSVYALKSLNKTLIIQMKFSLFVAIDRDTINANNITISLGTGDIFGRIPDEQIGDDGGYIGCTSRWGNFVCKLGYVVVDAVTFDRGKVFIYNGKVDEISAKKMFSFFRDNAYIPLAPADELDNPFRISGWSGAYDEKFNRLIFSRRDLRTTGRFSNFCISYSQEANEGRGGWVSFHNYEANVLFNNRQGIFSVYNYNLQINGIFKHNVNGSYGRWYDGLTEPSHVSYLDLIFNRGGSMVKVLKNIQWTINTVNNYSNNITQLMVYTDNQCSGLIELDRHAKITDTDHVRRINNVSRFNSFRDITIIRDTRSVLEDGTIVTGNLDTATSWFQKRRFINNYFLIRIQYDNVTNAEINIESVDITLNQINR